MAATRSKTDSDQSPARSRAKSMFGLISSAVIFSFAASGGSFAQTTNAPSSSPDSENGRYALSTVEGGIARLDKTTGQVSICNERPDGAWACYVTPDERAALDAEIGRLSEENALLKSALAASEMTVLGKIDEALPKSDSLRRDGEKSAKSENKIEIPLPSDADMQKAMGFLEKMWRQLLDMVGRVQKEVSGGI